jgi:hypothetical protein
MKCLYLLVGILSVFACLVSAQDKKKASPETGDKLTVAVTDLLGKGMDKSVADIFSERFRSELIQTGHFRVMERGQMDMVLKEQGFQQSGACSDEACLVEMGQIMGVERMISGSMGKLGTLYTISVRLINVATGEIMITANEDCDCEMKELLSKTVPALAAKVATAAGFQVKGAPAAAAASSTSVAPVAEAKAAPVEPPGTYKKRTMLGNIFLGAGVVVGAVAGIIFSGAGKKYDDYMGYQEQAVSENATEAEMQSAIAAKWDAYSSSVTLSLVLGCSAAALMVPSVYFYTVKVKVTDAPAKTKVSQTAAQPSNNF